MFLTSKFMTGYGEPILGLTPLLEIWEVESNLKVVDLDEMEEIANGWYKYDFNAELTKDYVVSCDGGDSLSLDIRYQDGTVDMSSEFIKQIEKGRWRIQNNQLSFYNKDNVTPIAVFDLKDGAGNPTSSEPAERFPV